MDQCEDREEGVPPSKTTLCGEHESQTKAQRNQTGPEPSSVSLQNDGSKDFTIDLKQRRLSDTEMYQKPEPSCVSLESDRSMDFNPHFKESTSAAERVDHEKLKVPSDQPANQQQAHLDSVFMLLEDNIITFVKNELKKIQKTLFSEYPECLGSQKEDEGVLDDEDKEEARNSRQAFVKITLHFLRKLKQKELADFLQSSKRMSLKI